MSKSKIEAVLREARALIKKGWTKTASARDKRGREVFVLGDSAVKFCAAGALTRATAGTKLREPALKVISGVVPGGFLPPFNDFPTTKKADVIAVFDRAIAVASKL